MSCPATDSRCLLLVGAPARAYGRDVDATPDAAAPRDGLDRTHRRAQNRHMIHVILLWPEIPPNTGNVMRLCANTGAQLHLVEPLGFQLDDTRLRRAGLDYADWSRIRVHPHLDDCLADMGSVRCLALTTRARGRVFDTRFRDSDALLFGRETAGLPEDVLARIPPEHRLRLPMRPRSRSLNLSNAVAVTVFEAWRQLGFPGAV